MRTTSSTHSASICISLFIQYALVVSITVLPFFRATSIQAQKKVLPGGKAMLLPGGGPAIPSRPEAADGHGLPSLADENVASLSGKGDDGLSQQNQNFLNQSLGRNIGLTGVPSLSEKIMGFVNSESDRGLETV